MFWSRYYYKMYTFRVEKRQKRQYGRREIESEDKRDRGRKMDTETENLEAEMTKKVAETKAFAYTLGWKPDCYYPNVCDVWTPGYTCTVQGLNTGKINIPVLCQEAVPKPK